LYEIDARADGDLVQLAKLRLTESAAEHPGALRVSLRGRRWRKHKAVSDGGLE
jgi:hypothetical protein